MRSLGPAADEAIPHEAGHLLIGKMVGIPTRGVDVEVVRIEEGTRVGISVGNFATLTFEPPNEEIPRMPPEVRAAYMLFVAGGVAGQKFDGRDGTGEGANADRKQLARINPKQTIEELAEMAVPLIHKRRRVFRRLVSILRERYLTRIAKNRNIQTGRHNLLNQEDLEVIFAED